MLPQHQQGPYAQSSPGIGSPMHGGYEPVGLPLLGSSTPPNATPNMSKMNVAEPAYEPVQSKGAWKTKASVRVPAFSGPVALAAALLIASSFSESFWQNFYLIEGKSLNVSMKAGAWGVCTRLRNQTGVIGPTTWCSSKTSGYNLFVVLNASGPTQFPTQDGDYNLLGFNTTIGPNRVQILTATQTMGLWLHTAAAIAALISVLTLIVPPSKLGSGRLAALQKSGVIPVVFAVIAFVLTVITFGYELAIAKAAVSNLNSIPGISGHLGNLQWFALPSGILMLPALASVLMGGS